MNKSKGMLRATLLAILLACFFAPQVTEARHLMGGELTYTWWKGNYFILKFAVYRDCANGPQLEKTINYKIFNGSDKSVTYGTYACDITSKKYVSPNAPGCQTPSGFCIEQGLFIDTVELGNDSVGYHIAWMWGNRNAAVINIANAATVGEVWYAFVPPTKYHNSSPQFLTTPLPYQCVKKKSTLNQDVFDSDKDSLSFSAPAPYVFSGANGTVTAPPYTVATYTAGYSATYPFGSVGAPLKIDAVTGEVTDSPTTTGQYVIAIAIKEYRYDPVFKRSVYLGEIRREYQFFVGSCATSSNNAPTFIADPAGYIKKISPDSTLCFDVKGKDVDAGDTLYLWVTGGIFDNSSGLSSPFASFKSDTSWKNKYTGYSYPYAKNTFCWKPDCDQVTYSSPYILTFNLADNNCNVTQKVYQIYVNTRPILAPPKLYCTEIQSNTQAKLSFSAISANSGVFKQYKIYRKADTASAYTVVDSISSISTTSWTDKTLKNANSHYYSYYITSQNSCGLEGLPSDTVNTIVVKYTLQSDKKVNFSWNKIKPGTNYYRIYTIENSGTTLADSITGLTYSFNKCYKKFSLKINVYNSAGKCTSISNITDTVTIYDKTAPNVSGKLINTSFKGATQVNVRFKPSDSADVSWYYIYRKADNNAFKLLDSVKHVNSQTEYNYVDKNALNPSATKYYYAVKAKDTCGNISAFSNIHSPLKLYGTAGQMQNTLNWENYYGYNFDSLQLQYFYANSGWVNIKTINKNDSVYIDKDVYCGIPKSYRLTGLDYSGKNQVTISDSISLTPFDTAKPDAPVIQNLTLTNDSSIYVVWKKCLAKDVKKYIVYRSVAGATAYQAIDTIDIDTFYTDNFASAVKTFYCYKIAALDSCGNNLSTLSNQFCSIYLTTSANTCKQEVFLKWNKIVNWPVGVDQYKIYRKSNGGADTLIATISSALDTFTDRKNLSNKNIYTYKIVAYQKNGSYISESNTCKIRTYKPADPVILFASKINTSTTKGTIIIKWEDYKKASNLHIKYHDLYVKLPGSSSFNLLQGNIPVTTDSFAHTDLNTKELDYEYRLIAFDSCGVSSDSSTIHKTMELTMFGGQLKHYLYWTPYKGWPVKKYVIELKTGNKWKIVDSVKGTDTTFLHFPAPCNTAFYYRITAVNYRGDQAISDTSGGLAIDSIPADAPLFYNATVVDSNNVKIDYSGADSLDIFGYAIMRRDTNDQFYSVGFQKFINPGGTFTFTDKVNTLENRLCYTIVTLDSCLNASPSDTFCTIQLRGKAMNQANTINWYPFEGYAVKEYEIQEWENNSWSKLKIVAASDTSFIEDPLACYVTRYYRIKATENGGSTITYSDTISLTPFDTIIPAAPVINYASVISGNGVKLSWNWDKNTDVKYYEIWRNDTSGNFTKIKTSIYDSSYIDTSVKMLNAATSYYLVAIDSCNMAHRSQPSDTNTTIKIWLKTGECQPTVHVNWSPYKGFAKNAFSYNIYRSQNGGAFNIIKNLPSDTNSFSDLNVKVGDKYVYRIEAKNTNGYSSFSDTLGIIPALVPVPQPVKIVKATVISTGAFDGAIKITWQRSLVTDTSAKGYRIYYSGLPNGPFTLIRQINNVDSTEFLHANINTRAGDFYYYITTFNICGKERNPSEKYRVINLQVQNKNLLATLSWNKYIGFPVAEYLVEKTFNSGNFQLLKKLSNSDSLYNDSVIYCGKIYAYRIAAISANGLDTSYSDTVTIKAFDTIAPQKAKINYASVIQTGSSGKIEISFNGAPESNLSGYRLYRDTDNSGFEVISTITDRSPQVVVTDSLINTKQNIHSYYITSFDSCGNEALASDTHTVVLLSAISANSKNIINWTAYKGFSKNAYKLEKRISGGNWFALGTFDNSTDTFEDFDVHCHVLYEYTITVLDSFSTYFSYSNTDTARGLESVPPIAPDVINASVTATSKTNGQIIINWRKSKSTDTEKYLLYKATGKNAFSLLATLPFSDSTFTDVNLNTMENTYSYKIFAVDSCGNQSVSSSEIHTTILLSGTPGNEFIKLNWTAYEGFTVKKYILLRGGSAIDSFDNSVLNYIDTNIICETDYKYQIKATGFYNEEFSYSNDTVVQSFDHISPAAVHLLSASVSVPNTKVSIGWTKTKNRDVDGYLLYRRRMGTTDITLVQKMLSPNDTTFTDSLIPNQQICYLVKAYDHCDNLSELSNAGCVILLNGTSKRDEHFLSWNQYFDWNDGIQKYNIYRRLDSNRWQLIGNTMPGITSFLDKNLDTSTKDFCYQVEAIENPGQYNATSLSTVVCLHQEPIVWVPNAFTPDWSLDDNDFFGPKGSYIGNYEMSIYNRWGELVYKTTDGKAWNGKSGSDFVPEGVYFYKITIHGYYGKKEWLNGTVTILR